MVSIGRRVSWLVCALLLSLTPLLTQSADAAALGRATAPRSAKERYIVTLASVAADVDQTAATLAKRYDGRVLAVWKHALRGFWVEMTEENARKLAQDRAVGAMEVDTRVEFSSVTPTGPGSAPPGGHSSTTGETWPPHTPDPLWHLTRITHRSRTTGDFRYRAGNDGNGARIYLIDSGVWLTHQEFATANVSSIILNPAAEPDLKNIDGPSGIPAKLGPTPAKPDPSGPYAPCGADETPEAAAANAYHGTATASLLVGQYVGVARGAELVSVKAIQCDATSTTAMLITAYDGIKQVHLATNPRVPSVISISTYKLVEDVRIWNGTKFETFKPKLAFGEEQPQLCAEDCAVGPDLHALEKAVNDVINAGIPVVASANNQNTDACYQMPGRLSRRSGREDRNGERTKVITVGAIDPDDNRWEYWNNVTDEPIAGKHIVGGERGSNFGQCVDIWAPGSKLAVAMLSEAGPKAYTPRSAQSGTSFAAPIVAGVIARLLAEDPTLAADPAQTAELVWKRLQENATFLNSSNLGVGSPKELVYLAGVTFTQQPQGIEAASGPVPLTVRVFEAADASYAYKWLRNGVDAPGVNDQRDYAAASDGDYQVRVTKCPATGSCADSPYWAESRVATVKITAAACVLPTMKVQPQSVFLVGSGPVEFKAQVEKLATDPDYRWELHQLFPTPGTAGPIAHGTVDEDGNAEHTFTAGQIPSLEVSTFEFRFCATASCGTCSLRSDTAQIRYCPAVPELTVSHTEPVHIGDSPGNTSISVTLAGPEFKPVPRIQWLYRKTSNDVWLPLRLDLTESEATNNFAGKRWRLYDTPSINPRIAGQYAALVATACDEKLSAVVDVLSACQFTAYASGSTGSPTSVERIVAPNTETVLTVGTHVPGEVPFPDLRYTWPGEAPGKNTSWSAPGIPANTTQTFVVEITDHSGRTDCKRYVTFTLTARTQCLELTTKGPGESSFGTPKTYPYRVQNGARVPLEVRPEGLAYEWFEILDGVRKKVTGAQNKFTTAEVKRTVTYEVQVKSGACTQTATFTLIPRPPLSGCANPFQLKGVPCRPEVNPTLTMVAGRVLTLNPLILNPNGSTFVDPDLFRYWFFEWEINGQLVSYGFGPEHRQLRYVTAKAGGTVRVTATGPEGCSGSLTYRFLPTDQTCTGDCEHDFYCKRRAVHSDNLPVPEKFFTPGESTTLSVSDTTGVTAYEWHRRMGGIDSIIGTTPTVTVTLTEAAEFWALVTVEGEVIATEHLIATPGTASSYEVDVIPEYVSVRAGGDFTLTASFPRANAQTRYEWRRGNTYNLADPIIGTDRELSIRNLADDSYFWCYVIEILGDGTEVPHRSSRAFVTVECTPTVGGHIVAHPPFIAAGYPSLLGAAPHGKGVSLEWYRLTPEGERVTISHGGAVNVFPTAAATRYGAVGTDDCGQTGDLNEATVYVCVPTITQQPQSIIIRGNTATTLTATATPAVTGQPIAQTWHDPDDQYHVAPLGSGETFTTPVLAPGTTASYRAAFKATCTGSVTYTLNSDVVVVQACANPELVDHTPVVWSTNPGSEKGISVSANGTDLTYQWYIGESGDTSQPLEWKTENGMLVYPQTTTSYWCRITSQGVCTLDTPATVVKVCRPPAIATHPQSTRVFQNTAATLTASGSANGNTEPLTYQWQQQTSGGSWIDVEGATSPSFTTPVMTGQYQELTYRFVVKAGYCSIASDPAVVSVCTYSPVVPAHQPESHVTYNGSVSLLLPNLSPVETKFITWYRGARGVRTNPMRSATGSNLANDTGPLTQDTQFWAEFTHLGCTTETETYLVRVCKSQITTQPADTSINSGGSATLTVATDVPPVSYQWYAGESGDTSAPVDGATTATLTISPVTSTKYWVRVKGCGTSEADSAAALVSVCLPATVASHTQSQWLTKGSTRELTVEGQGTNLTYNWYRGTAGDTANPIGSSFSVFVSPSNTTSYWARVTNACGSDDTETIVVSVCATPAITTQPLSQRIFSGTTATLSVAATQETTTPMTYQWYRGSGTGDPIGGATSSTFTTPALTAATTYWVRITAGTCSVDSAPAVVSMCAYNQTLNAPDDRDIAIGETVRLTANISPVPQQWRWYRGVQGDRTNQISAINYADVSPTTTTQYWGEFTHDGCAMQSRTVTVYVSVPNITQHPASIQVNNGETTTLTVAANTTGLTYQWYGGTSGSGTLLTGKTAASFTTPAMTATTNYWVKVTGSRGHSVNSNTATVSVCVPASISQEPAGASIRRGSSASLSVGAGGTNLRYQWYRASAPAESNPAGTTASISVTPNDPSNYWVKVTSDCGTKNSATATVSVCVDPTINTQPASQTIYSGTTATLSVTATAGTALPLSYQWYSGTVGSGTLLTGQTNATFTTPVLTASASYWVKVTSGVCSTNSTAATITMCAYNATLNAPSDLDIAVGDTARLAVNLSPVPSSGRWYRGAQGVTTNQVSSYTYADVAPTVTTEYWGELTHGSCTTRTRTVTVYVSIPNITQQPAANTQVNGGQSATLTVAANTAGLTYQWYTGTSGSGSPISGATGASYTTPALAAGSAASYWVRITGSRGHVVDSNTASVTWCVPPSISQHPVSRSIRRGTSVSMTVSASGTNLRYQWYRATSPNEVNGIASATASQYDIVPLDSEKYWVKVTGDCGTPAYSTTAQIDVCLDPTITTQPLSQTINSGGTATLSVAATANTTLGLTYQWYSGTSGGGTALTGETNPTFTTPALTSAANYWVKVTSGACSTNSATAAISLCSYPVQVNAPADKNAKSGLPTLLTISLNPTPQTYKWYRGAQGDRSSPLSSQPSFNVYPTVTTQYWGEFTNNGCTTKTRTMTINVCIPTIHVQPEASVSIPYATTATLSVTATEATTYQWFNGNTGMPISGATSATYTTPALYGDETYWVRTTGSCGVSTDSDYSYVTIAW